jgi:hypothetical protein
MIVSVEPAREAHVNAILRRLREHDREAFATVDDPAKLILDEIRQSTTAFVGLIDGEVGCLWGVRARTILSDSVYLWMITSTVAEEHPFVFVRHSRMMAQSILEEYGRIEGHVFVNNPMSMKWIKWLGATIEESPAPGVLEFTLRRA